MNAPSTQTLWNIPYQRNPFFTGREDVLAQLHQNLHADAAVALSHPQGISGLGGIGKTQTALEYAYRYYTDYNAIFWVRADSVTALISSMIELAHSLELPERDQQDQAIVVQAVLRWLRLHPGWLLIYDNIDDLSIAEPFFPKAGPGHLLFTTRAHALGGFAQRLDIQKMMPEIGALLLLRRADIITLQAELEMANPDDQKIALAISQELDGLPLALDQGGAYIKEAPCSLPEYLTRYQTKRGDILRERGNLDQNYPASVATTWSLSFEKVHQANPAASELLNFCAFLAPDAIPEDIITKGTSHLGPVLSPVANDPVQLDLICKEVLRYSLFHRGADVHTLTIHRLVQGMLQDSLSPETRADWKRRAVLAVNVASPDVQDVAQRNDCEQWLPHARVCADWIEQEDIMLQEAALLLNSAGYYLDERAQYTEAESLYVRALAIRERLLGTEHLYTAHSLNNLAMLYYNQGKYGQAELRYIQALQIYEHLLKTEHPDIARSFNNLALLYDDVGRYAEAETLYRRALAIRERQLGTEHPDTAQTLNNLAMLYYSQGKYRQAEPLLVQTLAIREQLLGAEHPDIAQNLSNLALLYYSQEKYEQAEFLYIRALAIRERQSENEHPDTATTLNNLAMLYDTQGKYKEAEPLYMRALQISEQQLGTEHPNTAQSLNNLAILYYNQGRYEEAEQLYKRALSIYEQQLGAIHPDLATSLNNLATLYERQGRYEEAEQLYKRALSIYEQQLGTGHPNRLQSRNNLAVFYKKQKKYAQAESLLVRSPVIGEQQREA